jgi:hypothetical protein
MRSATDAAIAMSPALSVSADQRSSVPTWIHDAASAIQRPIVTTISAAPRRKSVRLISRELPEAGFRRA